VIGRRVREQRRESGGWRWFRVRSGIDQVAGLRGAVLRPPLASGNNIDKRQGALGSRSLP
jgi:hypothetical protein